MADSGHPTRKSEHAVKVTKSPWKHVKKSPSSLSHCAENQAQDIIANGVRPAMIIEHTASHAKFRTQKRKVVPSEIG